MVVWVSSLCNNFVCMVRLRKFVNTLWENEYTNMHWGKERKSSVMYKYVIYVSVCVFFPLALSTEIPRANVTQVAMSQPSLHDLGF